jgi:hypothetical protein
MTRDELISRQRAMAVSSDHWALGYFVMYFAFLLACWRVATYMDDQAARWLRTLFGIVVISVLFGSIPLLFWFRKWQLRRFGVVCPSCGKPLVGAPGQTALATGSCAHCKEKVLS